MSQFISLTRRTALHRLLRSHGAIAVVSKGIRELDLEQARRDIVAQLDLLATQHEHLVHPPSTTQLWRRSTS
jgi:hypothetical protein